MYTVWPCEVLAIRLVITDCPLSGRGQGHVSKFYILDLENFVKSSVYWCDQQTRRLHGQLVDYTYEYDGRARRAKFIIMPNSHRSPDKTRQSCLCRVRRCELNVETVWQSLDSKG